MEERRSLPNSPQQRPLLALFFIFISCLIITPSPTLGEEVQTPPPPFSPGIFPCSGCHANMTPDTRRRTLENMHTDILFEHDSEHRWCLDCHDQSDRDKLRLASGEHVDFAESYRLCGQCHGPTYRDWRAGIHGKRVGYWNGKKNYLLCVHCHNPHSPSIKTITPFPAPEPPKGHPFIIGRPQ